MLICEDLVAIFALVETLYIPTGVLPCSHQIFKMWCTCIIIIVNSFKALMVLIICTPGKYRAYIKGFHFFNCMADPVVKQSHSPYQLTSDSITWQWASCQIRKIAGAHAPGMPGTFSPSPQVSDPDMHHGTCVTHVPWCMPGSLTSSSLWNRRRGKTFPAFPAHAQPAILRIW